MSGLVINPYRFVQAANIIYVGGKTLGHVGDTATWDVTLSGLSGGIDTAPSAGDFVIITHAAGSNANIDAGVTDGTYTEVADLYSNDDTSDANLSVNYKFMGGTPDSLVTMRASDLTTSVAVACVQVWRNVNATTPMDVAATTATGQNTARPTPPAITPSTPGAVIVCCGGAGHQRGANATPFTSTLSNFLTSSPFDNLRDVAIGCGSFAWTSGTYTPAQYGFWTTDNVTYAWAAVTMALRPA